MSVGGVNAKFIKTQIDAVRVAIGRDITVYTQKITNCTICVASGYYNPLNDNSWYFLCPQCAGNFYLPTVDATTVLARVHWTDREGITASPGGKYYIGDAYAHVDPQYLTLMENAQKDSGKVVVDGQDMQILKINPQGAPTINRLKIILKGMGDRPST